MGKKLTAALVGMSLIMSCMPGSLAAAASNVKTEVIVSEDFSAYEQKNNVQFRDFFKDSNTDANKGTGFSGIWKGTSTVEGGFGGAFPKFKKSGMLGGQCGTERIVRELKDTIPTDISAVYYMSFEMILNSDSEDIQEAVSGFSFMGDKYVIGAASNGTAVNLGIKTDKTSKISEKSITADGDTKYTYFAKVEINAQEEAEGSTEDNDKISLKVYEGSKSITAEPESYDVVATTEFGEGGISDLGVSFGLSELFMSKFSVTRVTKISAEEIYETVADKAAEWKKALDKQDSKKYIKASEELEDMISSAYENDVDLSSIDNVILFERLNPKDTTKNASETLDISQYFNSGIYADKNGTTSTNPNVLTGPNTGFELSGFKALDNWKNNWVDVKDGFNILQLGGTDYSMKVVECNTQSTATTKSTYCAWRTTTMKNGNDEVPCTNIDVEDGYYKSMNFLINVDTAWYAPDHQTVYLGLLLHYADGSSEFVKSRVYSASNDRSGSVNQVAADKIDGGRNIDGKLYLHELKIDTDENKILTGVDIMHEMASIDEENEFYFANDAQRLYRATIYAMTAVEDCRIKIMKSYNKFEELLDNIPATITSSNYAECEKLAEVIGVMSDCGVKVSSFEGVNDFLLEYSYIPKLKKTAVTADFEKVYVTAEFSTNVANVEPVVKKGTADVQAEVSVKGKVVTVALENDYDYKTSYELTLNSDIKASNKPTLTLGESKKITFNVPNVYEISKFELRDKAGNKMETSKDFAHKMTHETLYADFEITDHSVENRPTAITAAFYAPNGEMLWSKSAAKTMNSGDTLGWDNVEITTGLENIAGCRLVLYVWDSFGGMNSIYKDAELNF